MGSELESSSSSVGRLGHLKTLRDGHGLEVLVSYQILCPYSGLSVAALLTGPRPIVKRVGGAMSSEPAAWLLGSPAHLLEV